MDGSYLPSDLFFLLNDSVDERNPCTSWFAESTIIYNVLYISGGSPDFSHQQYDTKPFRIESSGAFHGFRRPWSTTSWSSEKDWERAAQMRWFWWSAKTNTKHEQWSQHTWRLSKKTIRCIYIQYFKYWTQFCAVLCLMSIVFWCFLHQLRREKIAWRAMQEEQAEKRKAVAREEAKWTCFSLFWSLIWSLPHRVGCWFAYYSGS